MVGPETSRAFTRFLVFWYTIEVFRRSSLRRHNPWSNFLSCVALFLLDAVHEMYLWQGWWPVNPDNSDSSATTTGSAEFRWHRDRRLAMQTIQSYADGKS